MADVEGFEDVSEFITSRYFTDNFFDRVTWEVDNNENFSTAASDDLESSKLQENLQKIAPSINKALSQKGELVNRSIQEFNNMDVTAVPSLDLENTTVLFSQLNQRRENNFAHSSTYLQSDELNAVANQLNSSKPELRAKAIDIINLINNQKPTSNRSLINSLSDLGSESATNNQKLLNYFLLEKDDATKKALQEDYLKYTSDKDSLGIDGYFLQAKGIVDTYKNADMALQSQFTQNVNLILQDKVSQEFIKTKYLLNRSRLGDIKISPTNVTGFEFHRDTPVLFGKADRGNYMFPSSYKGDTKKFKQDLVNNIPDQSTIYDIGNQPITKEKLLEGLLNNEIFVENLDVNFYQFYKLDGQIGTGKQRLKSSKDNKSSFITQLGN